MIGIGFAGVPSIIWMKFSNGKSYMSSSLAKALSAGAMILHLASPAAAEEARERASAHDEPSAEKDVDANYRRNDERAANLRVERPRSARRKRHHR